VAEAKRCETMVEDEVGKVKAEMEKEVGQLKALIETQAEQLKSEVEIGEIKVHTVKKNYHKLFICSWIFCAFSLFLFGYTYKGTHNGKVCCIKGCKRVEFGRVVHVQARLI
jgi:hypothetical protein